MSNGTNAGGALSAMHGASGNHPDDDAELQALGAAPSATTRCGAAKCGAA